MSDVPFTLGSHEALIGQLVEDMRATRADVSDIKTTLAEQRGQRKALVGLGAFVGAAASFFANLGFEVLGKRHP